MHYEEYLRTQNVHHTGSAAPMVDSDFYANLNRIATRRQAVLAEIARMAVKKSSPLDQAVVRGLDILFGVLGLLVCAIPLLVIATAIKIDSPGTIFFRQARVGKGRKVFQIIKFRSMRQNAESVTGPCWATPNDPRLTAVGAFLRRTKLDELPQLFNILMGKMTFVGPRPERPEFVCRFVRYMPAFDRRHDVKPGLTGLAQLRNGYDDSAESVYRKLYWDAQYLKRRSLQTDISILRHTVKAVLQGLTKAAGDTCEMRVDLDVSPILNLLSE